MINEYINLIVSLFAGLVLGTIFFGGLWLTIKKSLGSKTPALWLIGSFVLRAAITLTGFYSLSNGHWQQLLLCLSGFIIARIVIKRLLPFNQPKLLPTKKEIDFET